VPGRFKVIRHIREKLSCRACDTVVAAPAPDHAIARGRAGAGLLAHIVVSKYDDHLPLYRQAEIFARDGVGLETSTLSDWVGATAAALKPLVDALATDVLAGNTLHVDDTPVPVLAPGTGKTKTGRLWTYVGDERPFAGSRPAAALFFYSPDRKGEHPQAHLKDFRGVIHADGYAGFNELFAGGRIIEAACWAHVRRKFFDVHAATGSPIAKEALDRIGQFYAVEKTINGSPPERRRQQRQLQSKPIAEALAAWAEGTVRQLSRKSELARAFRYMRARWTALVRCFDDGRLALDNNPAERAQRCVAMKRSLYPPFSSVCKHCKLIFGIDATWATCSPDRSVHPFMLQVGGSDLVRSARHNLLGGEDAVPDQPSDAVARDAERRSGFRHRKPFAVLLGGTVGVDAMHPPQRADTVRGPGFSLASRHSHSVQRRGDIRVRPSGRHGPHHREGLLGGTAAMLAGLRLADSQLRVLAAAPMDCQHDLARCVVDISDDVGDQGAQKPLARAHGHAWRVPCGVEVARQASEVWRHDGRFSRPHCLQPYLARLDAAKRRLPALLKLRGDQAIVGITGSVAPFRKRGFIPGLLQLQFHDALLFIPSFHVPPLGLYRRLDRHRLHGAKKFSSDRGVDP
jgi:hypothetical protein